MTACEDARACVPRPRHKNIDSEIRQTATYPAATTRCPIEIEGDGVGWTKSGGTLYGGAGWGLSSQNNVTRPRTRARREQAE
jgi:hypothetical protein